MYFSVLYSISYISFQRIFFFQFNALIRAYIIYRRLKETLQQHKAFIYKLRCKKWIDWVFPSNISIERSCKRKKAFWVYILFKVEHKITLAFLHFGVYIWTISLVDLNRGWKFSDCFGAVKSDQRWPNGCAVYAM